MVMKFAQLFTSFFWKQIRNEFAQPPGIARKCGGEDNMGVPKLLKLRGQSKATKQIKERGEEGEREEEEELKPREVY